MQFMCAYVVEIQYDANEKSKEYTQWCTQHSEHVCDVCERVMYAYIGLWLVALGIEYSYCFAVMFACVRASTCVSVFEIQRPTEK